MSNRKGIQKKKSDKIENNNPLIDQLDWKNKVMGIVVNYNTKAIVGFVILILLGLFMLSHGGQKGIIESLGGPTKWKSLNLLNEEIPKDVEDYVKTKLNDIRIDQRTVTVKAASDIKVFYRESSPGPVLPKSDKTVILLHGQAFTSQTWQDKLPTIQTLATLGHRVIALDLPGFGNTENVKIGNKAEFLVKFFDQVTPNTKLIIVSPSMSGSFSLELLMKRPDLFCGYVPVAPAFTSDFDISDYQNVRVPTMIVMGEQDVTIGTKSKKMLVNIPSSTDPQIIPHARHPCYLDDPDRWHRLLHNFIQNLSC